MLKFVHSIILSNEGRLKQILEKRFRINHHRTFAATTQTSTTSSTPSATNSDVQQSQNFVNDWQAAKFYEDIPCYDKFTLFRNFMPGGKFAKLNSSQLIACMRNELGDIAMFKGLFRMPDTVITHNPKDFEIVFRNDSIWPNRPGSEALNYHRSVLRKDFFQGIEGVIGTQGEKWGTFRSAVNPVLMQPKIVRLYWQKMSQVNRQFIEKIREIRDPQTLEVPITFEETINCWALDSVSIVALDRHLDLLNAKTENPHTKKLFKALNDFFYYSVEVEFKPSLWRYFKTPTFNKLMKAFDEAKEVTSMFVNEAIQRLEKNREMGAAEKPENEKSVLEKLVKMDMKIAVVMAMDILMAGVDTTTSTTTGILLSLSKNSAKQAKLREEILKIIPQKDSEFTEEALRNMPYLRACIKESLRIYPLGAGNARVTSKDLVLSGYRIPKGTQVTMIADSLMRDKKYFAKADKFVPERWLRTDRANKLESEESSADCSLKANNPFVYLPFGFGQRSCIGRRVAELELELCVARIVRNFHVEFNHPTENAFKSLFINVPNIPLQFKFTDVEN